MISFIGEHWKRALRWLIEIIAVAIIVSLLGFLGLLFTDRSLSDVKRYIASVFDTTSRIEEKVDIQSQKLDQIVSTDCREVAEHSWNMDRGFITIGNDSISFETEKGNATFRKPISDLFMFDFIFKPVLPELFNVVVSFKDGRNREISLDVDTSRRGDLPSNWVYWVYKEDGSLINEESKSFLAVQSDTEIILRIETIQNPDGLDARAFLFYTPIGKQVLLPIYLKDLSVDRFQNKEVSLHLGISNFGQKIEGKIMLKIIQCSINPKQEFHL